MCQFHSVSAYTHLIKRMEDCGGKIKCWKKLKISERKVLRSHIYRDYIWHPGWNVSDVEDNTYPEKLSPGYEINKGIHVWLDITPPVIWRRGFVAVELTCHLKDLIGTDWCSAAFRRVHLPIAEYRRVTGTKKLCKQQQSKTKM